MKKRPTKAASKGPKPPTWLRKDCRARWRELLSQYGTDLRPHELETLARMAHCSVDLEAAEAAAAKCGTIVTGENGIAYIHPAVKHRNALATEFRMLLKMISTKKTAAVAATGGGAGEDISNLSPEERTNRAVAIFNNLTEEQKKAVLIKYPHFQEAIKKTAAQRQVEERNRVADLKAQDFNREQAVERAEIVPMRKGG